MRLLTELRGQLLAALLAPRSRELDSIVLRNSNLAHSQFNTRFIVDFSRFIINLSDFIFERFSNCDSSNAQLEDIIFTVNLGTKSIAPYSS